MTDDLKGNHDPRDEPQPLDFDELPLQPTGSGVADLDIAYAQEVLADDHGHAEIEVPIADGSLDLPEPVTVAERASDVESPAHPS